MGFDNESNVDRFLRCTTPIVPARSLPMTQIKNLNPLWYPLENESVEYFKLSDFWDCYDEWSAYGAGVPILSETGEALVQYYVPYLSAIQIFTSHSVLNALRRLNLGIQGASHVAMSGDGKDVLHLRKDLIIKNLSIASVTLTCSILRDVRLTLESLSWIRSKSWEKDTQGSLRSVDLSPASLMAIAWYPIYHIPTNRSIKDLSTCFLTYHTLSSSFQDVKKEEMERIRVSAFGMATYKMQGRLWDNDRLLCLLSVADSWLKQLRVHHHDFTYFTTTPHYL